VALINIFSDMIAFM